MKKSKTTKTKKNWKVLIFAIFICQMAGILGSIFTTPAIPTWYMQLNKPTFNPPSWIFGPVWVTLYTLMGIAAYRVWLKKGRKKGVSLVLKIFGVHLVLNSLWSIIFFGAKNIGFAFVEIVILWVIIIYLVKLFWKIDKLSGILLLPYLAWVSFAMILNLSIWTLNSNSTLDVYAQDFNYKKAYEDYAFTKDNYQDLLVDFNKKKDSYLKNPTLSLKEELRLSLYEFLLKRNDVITTYLTTLRMRISESKSLSESDKNSAISKISEEFKWYENYKHNYNEEDSLETLIEKSKEEDLRKKEKTDLAINYSLITIGYSDVSFLEEKHKKIYDGLKTEADNLVSLGRADLSFFERWFNDINAEFDNLKSKKESVSNNLSELEETEIYAQKRGFKDALEGLFPAKDSLLKINEYLYELENVVDEKR